MRAKIVMSSINKIGYRPLEYELGGFEVETEELAQLINFDWQEIESIAKLDSEGRLTIDSDLRDFDYKLFSTSNEKIKDFDKFKIPDLAKLKLTELYYSCIGVDDYLIPMKLVRFTLYTINPDLSVNYWDFTEENIKQFNDSRE